MPTEPQGTREPTLEELQEAFREKLTHVASKGLEGLSTQVPESLREKIQDQTTKSVQRTAKAYAEALHPFLKGYLDSKFATLSESIQQVLGAQVSAFSLPGPPLDGTTTTTQTSVTQSVTNTLVSASTETVSVSSTPSDLVLWRWNKTDISQFDPDAIVSNSHTGSLAYQAAGPGAAGPALVISCSWVTNASSIGFMAFRLDPSEIASLPQRFKVFIRISKTKRHPNANEEVQAVGPWYHNGNWTLGGLYGFGASYSTVGLTLIRAAGSGAVITARPFEEGVAIAGQQVGLAYPGYAQVVSFFNEAHIRQPVSASTSAIGMLNFYNMASQTHGTEATQITYQNGLTYNTSLEIAPLPDWYIQNIDQFGLVLMWKAPSLGSFESTIEISDIIITKHPTDW